MSNRAGCPSFAVLWGNHECMTGNPAAPWMADAWAKGVTNFDLATAYAGLKKNSVEGTWLPWRRGPKSSLDDFLDGTWLHAGIASRRKGNRSLQCIRANAARPSPSPRRKAMMTGAPAQMARSLGNDADYQFFLKRAGDYKNVFRQDKGHVWPKDADGNWIEPFDSGIFRRPGRT